MRREQLEKTAVSVRMASGIEVDNVYEGGGTCQVGPAWLCVLQLDCLTPVKPGLFHWRSLALFLDRRGGILARLACCARPRFFCLCSLSLSCRTCPRCPWCLYFLSLPIRSHSVSGECACRGPGSQEAARQCVQKVKLDQRFRLGLVKDGECIHFPGLILPCPTFH